MLQKPSEISKLIFEDDQYKKYRVLAIKKRKHTIVEDVVRFFRKHKILFEDNELYLLDIIVGNYPGENLKMNDWNKIKTVLLGVDTDVERLLPKEKRIFLDEIIKESDEILIQHFRKRCRQLLNDSK